MVEDKGNSSNGEEYNENDEVNSLIDDSFEADSDPTLYYKFDNVSRNPNDSIAETLNNDIISGEVSNYCQELSEDEDLQQID